MTEAATLAITPEQELNIRKPTEKASVPPLETYTDQKHYALEVEKLFRREWIPAGRVQQVENPGDYFTRRLFGEPVVVVKGRDGVIRAMSNVCKHRGAQVAEGCGRRSTLVCPYHAWSYNLDGTLRGAPLMEDSEAFDKSKLKLHEFKVEVWQGFIFVSLDDNPKPLLPRLTSLDKELSSYDFSDWVALDFHQEEADWNWKVSIENFIEAYHHNPVHATTVAPGSPPEDAIYKDSNSDNDYSVFYMPGTNGSGDTHIAVQFPPETELSELEMDSTISVNVFPIMHFLVTPGMVVWLDLDIRGINDHTLIWKVLVPKTTAELEDIDDRLEALKSFIGAVVAEDVEIMSNVRDAQTTRHFEPGRYSVQEKSLHQFHLYLMDQLTD